MSTIATLVTQLSGDAAIQASERIAPERLTKLITGAIAKHAPEYSGDNLPDTEDEAVVVLAWVELCYIRAATFVNSPDTQGTNGIGANRDNPYQRNMGMAARLAERYARIVGENETPDSATDVLQGKLIVKNRLSGAYEGAHKPAITLSLSKGAVTTTTAILRWEAPLRDDFTDYFLFQHTAPEIRADWNAHKVQGVPGVHPDAEFLIKIPSQAQNAVKVTDLEIGTEYYFLLVMKTLRDNNYYSNALRVVTLTIEPPLTDDEGDTLTP